MSRPILSFIMLGALALAAGAILVVGTGRLNPAPSAVPSALPSVVPSAPPSAATAASGPVSYPLADGEAWIAYIGANDEGVVLIRPDGSGRHVLFADLSVAAKDVRWSPDGQQLVFEGNGSRGSQLWAGNADGTGARQLTPTPDGCASLDCTEAVNPAWSPDGATIAYIAPKHASNIFFEYDLMLLDVATGTTTTVYRTATEGLGRPTWSPDSRHLALEIDHYELKPESSSIKTTTIAVVDLQATDRTPLEITDPDLLAGYPAWHPTDDLLVVRTNRVDGDQLIVPTTASNVYTLRSDGTGLKQVTTNPVGGAIARAPSWTSDGRILYSTIPKAGSTDERLRIMSATGTGDASATGATTTTGEGVWRPTP
jgi:dipeptidyl aminopeptidase/acylaminoacyl peptidase